MRLWLSVGTCLLLGLAAVFAQEQQQKPAETQNQQEPIQGPTFRTGIDLVARERDSGEYTAIQCKFYEPTHTLRKEDIDSFFTASGKNPLNSRKVLSCHGSQPG